MTASTDGKGHDGNGYDKLIADVLQKVGEMRADVEGRFEAQKFANAFIERRWSQIVERLATLHRRGRKVETEVVNVALRQDLNFDSVHEKLIELRKGQERLELGQSRTDKYLQLIMKAQGIEVPSDE